MASIRLSRGLVFAASLFVTLQSACADAGKPSSGSPSAPTSFQECVAQSGKVLKSFPARCVTAEGITFVDTSQSEKAGRACKDLCGDGQCQEIVCMEIGCPCAETPDSCPQDCKQ